MIPALGWPLGTRAQMFWLEEGLPSSLAPGTRPRTTLSPSLALRDGKPYLAFGTPGGDQQDQWALHFFLRHVDLGDEPAGGDRRARGSTPTTCPRRSIRGRRSRRSLSVEARVRASEVVDDLRRRGHDVEVTGPWSLGRVSAVRARPTACSGPARTRAACRATRPGGSAAVRRSRDPRRVESPHHLRMLLRRTPPHPHHVLRRRILEALALVAIVDAGGTVLMWLFEDDAGRGEIHNIWDAFFFTTVQLLTVSSQMRNPVTTPGGSSTSCSS